MTNEEKEKKFLTKNSCSGFEYNMFYRDRMDNNAVQVLHGIECLILNMEPMALEHRDFYRARVVKTANIKESAGFESDNNDHICAGFNAGESGKAPEKYVNAGRINRQWESIWYLTDDKYTSLSEVRPAVREQISLARYKIADYSNIRVLDFCNPSVEMNSGFDKSNTPLEDYDIQEIYVLIQKLLTLPAYDEQTYYVSNKIVDFAKASNISGIKYKSFYGPGNNIALWNISEDSMVFQDSELFLLYSVNHAFINVKDAALFDNERMYKYEISRGFEKPLKELDKMYKSLKSQHKRR